MKTEESKNTENPFKVPENYFEALPDRITQRINSIDQEQDRKPKVTFRNGIISIAAVLILALGVFSVLSLLNENKTIELTSQDISQLFDDYIVDFEEDAVVDLWKTGYIETESFDSLTEVDEIIDYLIDIDVEEYLLIAEL